MHATFKYFMAEAKRLVHVVACPWPNFTWVQRILYTMNNQRRVADRECMSQGPGLSSAYTAGILYV